MKSFKSTAWLLPQPVLIIGTYDKEGKPNVVHIRRRTTLPLILSSQLPSQLLTL